MNEIVLFLPIAFDEALITQTFALSLSDTMAKLRKTDWLALRMQKYHQQSTQQKAIIKTLYSG